MRTRPSLPLNSKAVPTVTEDVVNITVFGGTCRDPGVVLNPHRTDCKVGGQIGRRWTTGAWLSDRVYQGMENALREFPQCQADVFVMDWSWDRSS